MIGTGSFLLELALPLCTTAMLVALGVMQLRKPTRNGWVGVFVLLVFAVIVDMRLYYGMQNRTFLQSLRADEVKQIRVGDRRIRDRGEIGEVVKALNGIEWFSANRGGWARREWLVLDLTSGERRPFLVAQYLRKQGAVIQFGRPPQGGGFHDGYAFAPALPEVLQKYRAPLPVDQASR
jgi:hypothetical protein